MVSLGSAGQVWKMLVEVWAGALKLGELGEIVRENFGQCFLMLIEVETGEAGSGCEHRRRPKIPIVPLLIVAAYESKSNYCSFSCL